MSEVVLIVDERRFSAWKSVRISRSIDRPDGTFSLVAYDRWGEGQPWQILEEDPCRVELDGETVIDGFVEKRRPSFAPGQRNLAYEGRDRAGALIECSAYLEKWTMREVTALDVARRIAEAYSITVTAQPGLQLAKMRKFVVSPGERAFAAMARAANSAGVRLMGDGSGGLLLTRGDDTTRAVPLIEGENLIAGGGDYDSTERFHRYVVLSQAGGTSVRVRAEAFDEGVRRKDRTLVLRPEKGLTTDFARQRGDWEARVRAARGDSVTVTVLGWRQRPGGELWPVNALVDVQSPTLGISGDMRIARVDLETAGSDVAVLQLVRPDALTPEPQKPVVKGSGGLWKELNHGALPE